jgi:hypothetical protein
VRELFGDVAVKQGTEGDMLDRAYSGGFIQFEKLGFDLLPDSCSVL